MNWKRYRNLIVLGCVCAVISGVFVVWILRAQGQTRDIQADVERLQNQRNSLLREADYPGEGTHEELQEKLGILEERRERFMEVIAEGQIQPPEMDRSRFNDYLRTRFLPPLHEAARESTRGGDRGVVLRDPAFGMQTYLEGNLPDARQLPQLMLELELIKHVSLVLFETGISELISIEARSPEVEEERREPRSRGLFDRQRPQEEPEPADEEVGRVEQRRRELFEPVSFEVRLKVYEDILWDVLNRLASDSNQMAVSHLTITNDNHRLWPTYLRPPPGRASPREERRPEQRRQTDLEERWSALEMGEPTPREEVSRRQVGLSERRAKITGGDLLHVTFRLTVFRLQPTQGL